ncbi:putative quinol monooxygenase [Streptomyces sp. NPDC059788]|uniref:putative quinol monooxygenase n=1 Tax=Streptomyces sp. NPDC059788 TaxID=3346948 RepID=UPI0036468BAA
MPVVVATVRTKPGELEAALDVFRSHAPAVHEEDGCLLYAVHAGEDRVVVVENWADGAALDAHSRGAALTAIAAGVTGLLAAPMDVAVLDAVPMGDPGKSTL